jgi:carboxyl-terminal processing protease
MPRYFGLIAAAIVLLAAGIYLGGHPDRLPGFVRDPLVGDQDTRVVREAIQDIHDTYYRSIPESQLADDSVKGIVSSLHDRFSNYFTPKEYKHFQDVSNSEFSGIGIEVQQDPKGLRIARVFDNSPAKREHLQVGDRITAVGKTSLKGRPVDYSRSLITGPPGSDVTLTIERAGKSRPVSLTRATITAPVVASSLRTVDGKKLAVIALDTFTTPGAHAQVYDAIQRRLKQGAQGIVLDLRHNGGGLVKEAQLVASAFIPKGKIVSLRGRGVAPQTLNATGDTVAPRTPLVVLVDRDTASASEIVTGALQDHKRAEVVGTRTFGKGVFQEVIELRNGGALDITAGQYFTPDGHNLGGGGVKPGAGIQPDVKAVDNPKTPRDEALDRALRVLAAQSQ